MNPITVLLADDHAIIREGVMDMLKQEDGIAVIGEAENGREAVAAVSQLRPDVVVMDISMPQLNGMEAARQILEGSPGTKIIILSAHHDAAFISLVTAIGASGYLNKHSSAHDLPAAIREVHQGRSFFRSPSLSVPPDEDEIPRFRHAAMPEAQNQTTLAQSVLWHRLSPGVYNNHERHPSTGAD